MTPDPRELLAVLARRDVDFVVIGGVAVQAYGHVRTTRDLDIVAEPSVENGARLAAALVELEAVNRGVDAQHLDDPTDPATFTRAGSLFLETRAGLLDIMQDAAGAPPYRELRERAVPVRVGGVEIRVAGIDDLIALKRAAARPVDLEDIAVLTDLQRLARRPGLERVDMVEVVDPAVALLGERPRRGRAMRAWDHAAEAVYLYRDEFGRPARVEPANPLGPRPPAGTRQRRVWERLVARLAEARERLPSADGSLPGDLGEDVAARNNRP